MAKSGSKSNLLTERTSKSSCKVRSTQKVVENEEAEAALAQQQRRASASPRTIKCNKIVINDNATTTQPSPFPPGNSMTQAQGAPTTMRNASNSGVSRGTGTSRSSNVPVQTSTQQDTPPLQPATAHIKDDDDYVPHDHSNGDDQQDNKMGEGDVEDDDDEDDEDNDNDNDDGGDRGVVIFTPPNN
ncbi:hypothetical protein FRC03_000362 [Tulasnella sp. 419]|nr:hypothetical protein FRC03_000362 [Tulasnella sp. 419]